MHMVGYFEGIASERGIAWRCSDSYSLRDFLRLENREEVPDHSWLSKTRGRLPHEVHESVFGWVLKLVAEQGLVKGKRIGVDASTMEANAALRTIVRRDDGRTYREMLTQMAKESGIETPTADESGSARPRPQGQEVVERRVDQQDRSRGQDRQAKGRSHPSRLQARACGRSDTGIIVAAALHPADQGDTTTIEGTLTVAEKNLAQIGAVRPSKKPSELVTDKGYHSRAVLKALDAGVWKTRIAEPKQPGFSRWHGDDKARAAVYANRTRLGSAVGKQAMRRRSEIVERSFAHNLDRGGMRRTWLRGRENVHKRYLVHVAGHNLGILMRLLVGAGTPREAGGPGAGLSVLRLHTQAAAIILVVASPDGFAILVIAAAADPG